MTSVPCPRCGMLVELEQEVCTHCRTPRDDMEMEEGRTLVRNEELRLKRRPKRIAAGAAAAVLLGTVWLLRGAWTPPLIDAWNEFQAEVEETRQPGHWIKEKAVEPAAAPVPAAVPVPAVAVSSFIFVQSSASADHFAAAAQPEPSPPPQPATPPPPAAVVVPAFSSQPPAPGEIRVQGTVYDLATTNPVKHATIRFESRTYKTKWKATTNAAGQYEITLYKNDFDAVSVMIEEPGYRKGLLEDRDPPYRERSRQSREDLMAETIDSDLEPVPLRYRESAQIVVLDLVLVPPAKK